VLKGANSRCVLLELAPLTLEYVPQGQTSHKGNPVCCLPVQASGEEGQVRGEEGQVRGEEGQVRGEF